MNAHVKKKREKAGMRKLAFAGIGFDGSGKQIRMDPTKSADKSVMAGYHVPGMGKKRKKD